MSRQPLLAVLTACALVSWGMFVIAADDAAKAAPEKKPAEAKAAGPDAPGLFARLDVNNDGQLTAQEAGTENATLYNRLLRMADKNGDQQLSAAEFTAGLNQPETPSSTPVGPGAGAPGFAPDPEMVFRRMDANRDGKVTPAEMPEERRAMFAGSLSRFDKDNDKALNLEEFKEMFGRMAGKGPPPAVGAPGGELLKRVMEGDKNNDGKLTKDELPERLRERFDRLDANQDGAVDRAELLRGFAAMAEKGKAPEKKFEPKKGNKK